MVTKDIRYIIKRIIISIGIIIILSFLKGVFVLEVNAQEIENGFTQPVYLVPNENELHYCDNFITNFNMSGQGFGNCGNEYIPQIQLHYYSNMIPSLNQEYPYFSEDTDNPTYTYNSNTKWYDNINYHTLYNLVGYNITLYRYGFNIKNSTEYSLMIEIEKSNNIDYSYDELNLDYLSIWGRDINGSAYDITDYIKDKSFQYVKGYNSNYNSGIEGEPYYSNNSYIVLNFTTASNITSVGNNIAFSNISLYVNKGTEEEQKHLLKNNKAIFNPESTGTLKHKISFVEGAIQIQGQCDQLSGYCDNGLEYWGDYDIVTEEDRELFEEYETCELTNIPCHLRNLLKGINNIIVRVGNGIKQFFQNITRAIASLFIPNFESMSATFQEFENALMTKTGFIWESEQYFIELLNRFLEIDEGNVVINIPQIKVPNFDYEIISAQTWNFSEPFNNNQTLKTFYDTYKILISGVFIFLLINHARYRLGALLNFYDMEVNGNVREGVKTE